MATNDSTHVHVNIQIYKYSSHCISLLEIRSENFTDKIHHDDGQLRNQSYRILLDRVYNADEYHVLGSRCCLQQYVSASI